VRSMRLRLLACLALLFCAVLPAGAAECFVKVKEEGYLATDSKTALVVSTGAAAQSFADWTLHTATGELVAKGALRPVKIVAVVGQRMLQADFSEVQAAGSYVLKVPGCESATFEITAARLARQITNTTFTTTNAASTTAATSTTGYSDPGISRGAGIALIVITVILFVIVLVLGVWVLLIYCCWV